MRIEDYEHSIQAKLNIKKKMEARKSYCACYLSNDIGAYDSCLHLCRYCYANGSDEEIRANYQQHDPHSPLLIGHVEEGDVIHDAAQESYLDSRISLF
jgi:hypothetical protein